MDHSYIYLIYSHCISSKRRFLGLCFILNWISIALEHYKIHFFKWKPFSDAGLSKTVHEMELFHYFWCWQFCLHETFWNTFVLLKKYLSYFENLSTTLRHCLMSPLLFALSKLGYIVAVYICIILSIGDCAADENELL